MSANADSMCVCVYLSCYLHIDLNKLNISIFMYEVMHMYTIYTFIVWCNGNPSKVIEEEYYLIRILFIKNNLTIMFGRLENINMT